MKLKLISGSAGILVAATLGAGIFALPYVFARAGWLLATGYLVLGAIILYYIHTLYRRILIAEGERERLLGLARRYLPKIVLPLAFISIILELLLTLVIYLVLSSHFFGLILPGINLSIAIFIFWLVATTQLWGPLKEFARIELSGTIAVIILVFFIAVLGLAQGHLPVISPANWGEVGVPLGAILFAMAGWTAIEPIVVLEGKTGKHPKRSRGLLWGTVVVVVLFLLFVFGILSLTKTIGPDTVSGLGSLSPSIGLAVGLLGLFTLWMAYGPIGREVQNILHHDLRWPVNLGVAITIFVPPALVLLGMTDFLKNVALVGGVFLSIQYLFILGIARKALRLSPASRVMVNFLIFIFSLIAVYSAVYYFQ